MSTLNDKQDSTTTDANQKNIKRWLSCLRPKGEEGKCWAPYLNDAERSSYPADATMQFFTEKGVQADSDNAWPSHQARNRYQACLKYFDLRSKEDDTVLD